MSVGMGKYTFEGPYNSTACLEDRAGIYAILTPVGANKFRVVDIGESATVRSRVEHHDRSDCWTRNASREGLCAAVYYTPYTQQAGRVEIERELRQQYSPACGIR